MRRLALLVILSALALPAGAAKRTTVAQLERTLTGASALHRPDAELARQIEAVELTERLTDATRRRIAAQVVQGTQSALALELLADQSVFFDPPPSELPDIATPDEEMQWKMIAAARSYCAQILPRLPNFLATRTTKRYDDTPQALKQGGWSTRAGFHLVDSSSGEVSIRNDLDARHLVKDSTASVQGIELSSWGEFGATLGIVLTDTSNGKVNWSHWEETAEGKLAVFHYSVSRPASHYEIVGMVSRGPGVAGLRTKTALATMKIGYHGSIWVDPVTGTIFRLTLEADPTGDIQFLKSAVMVQYAPVKIGDSTFICPVRSLTLYEAIATVNTNLNEVPTKWLNESLFTGYHRFASTTRILTDVVEQQPTPK